MKRSQIGTALLLVVAFAAGLAAQDKKQNKEDASTRVVQGSVVDAGDQAAVGAVVLLKDMRTLQVRSFIAQENGAYHFSGLKVDNDYELKADHNGATSGWKKLSVFDSRKEPIINLKLDKKQ